ncbi:MAG TPA: hypothetical protein VMM56_16970, partial [Planctomycetaceae bacterium]|nr:hypothetical protein [Planctomycetaceae bacterium]
VQGSMGIHLVLHPRGLAAQRPNMKQAKIRNNSRTTLKPSKTPGFHPKIPKMERCDLPHFPPLKNPGNFDEREREM